jgi:hypothetical protein
MRAGTTTALFTIVLSMAVTTASARQPVPLPRPRPPGLDAAAPVAPATSVTQPSDCQQELGARAEFTPLPPLVGPGGCGATDAVRLEAVIMPDHRHIPMEPPPTLRCTMAGAVADWVRGDLAAEVATLGAPLRSIETYDSYDCRGMNRVVGAKLSEHGRANALDVHSFRLANGATVLPTDASVSRAFREGMRDAACVRFTTLLGPGSDGYHEEHIHVDLAERHGGYRICHWEIREPAPVVDVPLPRPRPESAHAGRKL